MCGAQGCKERKLFQNKPPSNIFIIQQVRLYGLHRKLNVPCTRQTATMRLMVLVTRYLSRVYFRWRLGAGCSIPYSLNNHCLSQVQGLLGLPVSLGSPGVLPLLLPPLPTGLCGFPATSDWRLVFLRSLLASGSCFGIGWGFGGTKPIWRYQRL